MQDPEIQNILSDPVMRQVGIEKDHFQEYNFKILNGGLLFSIVLHIIADNHLDWDRC